MRALALVWRLVALLSVAGCVSAFNLATQREEYTLTSTAKEVETGRKLARQVERELTLVADEPLQQRVDRIGQRIAAVCDRRELDYHFAVVADEEVNAFSLPGGYVFIHEGLVKHTAGDDELAAVIAHEIGHITARHAVKRYEHHLELMLAQLATMAARQGAAARGVGIAAQAAQLAYARQDELDADRLGVKYLKAAGFDPTGMLRFLQKLHQIDLGKSQYLPRDFIKPQYARTHPYVPQRLRAVKEALFGVADYVDYLNSPE